MQAINDHIGKDDSELTFKTGDIIFVPALTPGDTLKGVFGGKVGTFKRAYVKDTTVEIKEQGKTTRVEATRAYEAPEGSEELSFPKGAKMFVVAKVNDKHWKGVYNGVAGLIPATHVQDATKDEVKVDKPPAKCKAIKSLVPDDPAAIAFKVGDTVFVPKPDDSANEWQCVANGVVGLVDKSYLMDTNEEASGLSAEDLNELLEEAKAEPAELELIKKFEALMVKRKEILGK